MSHNLSSRPTAGQQRLRKLTPPTTVAPKPPAPEAPVPITQSHLISFEDLSFNSVIQESSAVVMHAGTWLYNDVTIRKLGVEFSPADLDEIQKAVKNWQHPFIESYYGACAKLDSCLVTEPGNTLSDHLSSNLCRIEQKTKFALEIAKALLFLHSKNLTCGALQPHTIMITATGQAKLMLECLPTLLSVKNRLQGQALKDQLEQAPELKEPTRKPTIASDLFACGMLLKYVFSDETPEAIAQLIRECTASDPAKRPSLKQIIERLIVVEKDMTVSPQALFLRGEEHEQAREDEQAFHAYFLSAKSGYCKAQTNLAMCFIQGKGCDKDKKRAFYWMLKSAKQGLHPRSQFNVAKMYEKGDGTEKNLQEAIHWYQKAEANGSVPAKEALVRLNAPTIPSAITIPNADLSFQDLLGEGSFGTVHRGTWSPTSLYSKTVAIKQLKMTEISNQAYQEFLKEVTIHVKLDSPGIVKLFGATAESPYCMVMEVMENGSLRDFLKRKGQNELSWSTRIEMAINISTGLSYLHSQKPVILHGDLKSLNILVNVSMQAKLADFGLATVKTESRSQMYASGNNTDLRGPRGTFLWLAPELFQINQKRTTATDVFSLAIVLWELASHRLPYDDIRDNLALIKQRVIDGHREAFDERTSGAPEAYIKLTQQSWTKKPEERLSVDVILQQLKELGSHPQAFFASKRAVSPPPTYRRSCLVNTGLVDSDSIEDDRLLLDSEQSSPTDTLVN